MSTPKPRQIRGAAPAPAVRLAALVGVLVGGSACRRQPESADPPPSSPPSQASAHPAPPPPSPGETGEPGAPAAEFVGPARYLPSGALAGWRQQGAVTRSDAAGLYQVMDGNAAAYEAYGVTGYARADYRKPGSSILAQVEAYEFATALGAYGRYSRILADGRDPAALAPQAVPWGDGGVKGGMQLTFIRGTWLVQASVTDDSEEPLEAPLRAAAATWIPAAGPALAGAFPAGTASPPPPLPSTGRTFGGAVYFARDLLGVEGAGQGWVGHYQDSAAHRWRVVWADRDSSTAAAETLRRFRAGSATALAGLGDEAWSVTSSEGEQVWVRAGPRIRAVLEPGVPGATSHLDRSATVQTARDLLAGVPPSATSSAHR